MSVRMVAARGAAIPSTFVDSIYLPALTPGFTEALFARAKALDGPFAMERLAALGGPVRVVIGGEDRSARGVAAALARSVADGKAIVIPRCGHFPQAERPEAAASIVAEAAGATA